MNKYKVVFWMLRVISFTILLGTFLLLIVPVYINFSKPVSKSGVSILLQDQEKYSWIMNHEKIKSSSVNDAPLIIADEQILNHEFWNNIKQKTIVTEDLFYQLNEQPLKIKQLSSITGVTYTGYSGKTYQDLSNRKEVPQKLIEQYEKNTHEMWSFQGEGIIISSNDHVIVLKKGVDYRGTMMLVTTDQNMPYVGKFEITTGSEGTEKTADFNIDLTTSGEAICLQYNIAPVFPASYEMTSPLYHLYYFAGDYSSYKPDIPAFYEILPMIMKNKLFYDVKNGEQVYWQWYYPYFMNILKTAQNSTLSFAQKEKSNNHFYVLNKEIYIKNDEAEGEQFFIKGINLGAALPGKTFTEFPQDKELYLTWFREMVEMNVNTIRVYTLFPPVFYEALYEFNKNRSHPLYLLQEIWPEEDVADSNCLNLEYNEIYQLEIKNVVDSIHGNGYIANRNYRASGIYRFDVSNYLLGYLVGRELTPDEVLSTDELNNGYVYHGVYLSSNSNASPTEGWLAQSCDYVLQVEEHYNSRPLVGIVSWPTLDSLTHDSEWNISGDKSMQYNDSAVVDINHIDITSDNVSGFFGAYHIYPNYPDFMNNEATYANYKDKNGVFRYGGYLQAFMKQNKKYPAIVAEYGISTSMYTAHYNPDGLDHGGLSETEQADGIIRMTEAIQREHYAGAIIFEWMDEWTKKTWTTEPYMIPYQNNPYWHNAMDPEQNYGIVAYKTKKDIEHELSMIYQGNKYDRIHKIRAGQDEAYVYLDIEFSKNISTEQNITLAISNDSEKSGTDFWEFLFHFNKTPMLLVNPGYNWIKGHYAAKDFAFSEYEELIQITNNENTSKDGTYVPYKTQNLSVLSIGSFEVPQNQIELLEKHMLLRLPYGLLGISDPSTKSIFSDEIIKIPSTQDSITITQNDYITYLITYGNRQYTVKQKLNPWQELEYYSVKKKSYEKISEYFGRIN